MLRIYIHYEHFYSYSTRINFSRQVLTIKRDSRAVRINNKLGLNHRVVFDHASSVSCRGN